MFTFKKKIKSSKKLSKETQRFIIYKHTNIINGKCYIGQTNNTIECRWKGHLRNSKKDEPKLKFHKAIKKYGEENFTHEILEELVSELFANASEIYWIEKFQSADPSYGYNMTFGGDVERPNEETKIKMKENHADFSGENHPQFGKIKSIETRKKISVANTGQIPVITGKHHTLETRKKISVANTGKPKSEESKRKMSESHKGKKHTKKSKQKISVANTGKKRTQETKLKISQSRKGKKNSVPRSTEHCQKISESRKGKPKSEETKQKLSKSNKGKSPPNKGKKMTPEQIAKRTATRRCNKEIRELAKILLSFYEPGTLWNN